MYDPFCPMCGYQNEEGVSICSKCGSVLEEDLPSGDEEQQAEAPLQASEEDSSEKKAEADVAPDLSSVDDVAPVQEVPSAVSDYEAVNDDEESERGTRLLNNRFKKIRVAYTARKSTIYRALDSTTGDIVAVKEMVDRFSSDYDRQVAIKTFREEARRMMKFEHPGLPRVIDFFEEDGKYYIVKTFVEGENLKNRMKARGNKAYDQELILNWTRQILETLHYLHNQSPPYIYKILKPSNVHVDKDDQAYLIDFDIDRIFTPKKENGDRKEASHFAAPELKDGFSDGRSDLYSLGMLIRFLFTGINPDDESRYTRFKRIRDVNDRIYPWLDELVLQMVSPSGQNRPASAKSLMDIIDKHADSSQTAVIEETRAKEPAMPTAGPVHPRPHREKAGHAAGSEVKVSTPSRVDETDSQAKPVSREWLGLGLIAMVPILLVAVILAALFLPGVLAGGRIADGDRAMKAKDYSAAFSCYEEADKMKSSATTLERLGDASYRLDKYKESVAFYDRAIERDPGRKDDIHRRMALAYMAIGREAAEKNDFISAGSAFEQALLKNPELAEVDDPKLLLLRGVSLLHCRKFNLALRDYTRLTELEPSNADGFKGKGLSYMKMGKTEEALAEFKKAASLNKTYLADYQSAVDFRVKAMVDGANQKITAGNLAEAMEELALAEKLSINSDSTAKSALADALANAATLQYRQGDMEKALATYGRALDIFPYCYKALAGRAAHYQTKAEYKKAFEDYKKITTLNITPFERQSAARQMEYCRRMAEYEERRTATPTPTRTPYPLATATATPKPAGTKKYFLMGKSYKKALLGSEGKTTPLLISGSNLYSLQKNTWYEGLQKGDQLTLWFKRYGRETEQVYTTSPVEIVTVAYISQKRKKVGRYSYTSSSTITFKRPGGSIVTVEDTYLARKLSQGQTLYASVGINDIELFTADNDYSGNSYKISGSGGIY